MELTGDLGVRTILIDDWCKVCGRDVSVYARGAHTCGPCGRYGAAAYSWVYTRTSKPGLDAAMQPYRAAIKAKEDEWLASEPENFKKACDAIWSGPLRRRARESVGESSQAWRLAYSVMLLASRNSFARAMKAKHGRLPERRAI